MKKNSVLFMLLLVFTAQSAFSQQFLYPFSLFSHNETSRVILKDGSEVEGTLDKLKRKRGLPSEITFKVDGKKTSWNASDVQGMYLKPNDLNKMAAASDFMSDATQWEDTDLDKDILGKGFVYFEQKEVIIGKKKQTLMLQLLNPSFASKVQVYHDPYANETASTGIGGITVDGGDAKSYFVSINGDTAFKLKKKDYTEATKKLFGDCGEYLGSLGKKPKWSEFAKHLYDYGRVCSGK